MTTRSKNKPAAKQVPKTPPGLSLDPDHITAARTPGVDPLIGHQLSAAIIESARTLTTAVTSPLVPAPAVPLSILLAVSVYYIICVPLQPPRLISSTRKNFRSMLETRCILRPSPLLSL
jgi:hypothetical protein